MRLLAESLVLDSRQSLGLCQSSAHVALDKRCITIASPSLGPLCLPKLSANLVVTVGPTVTLLFFFAESQIDAWYMFAERSRLCSRQSSVCRQIFRDYYGQDSQTVSLLRSPPNSTADKWGPPSLFFFPLESCGGRDSADAVASLGFGASGPGVHRT